MPHAGKDATDAAILSHEWPGSARIGQLRVELDECNCKLQVTHSIVVMVLSTLLFHYSSPVLRSLVWKAEPSSETARNQSTGPSAQTRNGRHSRLTGSMTRGQITRELYSVGNGIDCGRQYEKLRVRSCRRRKHRDLNALPKGCSFLGFSGEYLRRPESPPSTRSGRRVGSYDTGPWPRLRPLMMMATLMNHGDYSYRIRYQTLVALYKWHTERL